MAQAANDGGLLATLGLLPEPLPGDDPDEPVLWVFASDFAAQFASVGVPMPETLPPVDQWRDVTDALERPYPVFEVMTNYWQETRDVIGFDFWQVQQVVSYRTPSVEKMTVLRGAFDRSTVEAAWARSGYVPVGDGVVSLFPNSDTAGEFSVRAP